MKNKIEAGKLTDDDKGKPITVRQIKTERLPAQFKQLMSHSVVHTPKSKQKSLRVKQKKENSPQIELK